MLLTQSQFQKAAGISSIVAARWLEPLCAAANEFQINTPKRLAAFIAQVGHESGGFNTVIRTLDYVRKACRERISLRFPRDKLSSRTPPKVQSELLDVLIKLEELEIIEEVEANKSSLIVERDSQDSNQLNARIPADVVNGLHVFAGRIDLLL